MNEISVRDDDVEATPEIIASVMSRMRKKREYIITASAMRLDEDETMELKEGYKDDDPNSSSEEEDNKTNDVLEEERNEAC
ncbi:hypothetical protein [Parasitella parasitica]|uniref:Uncharacterized protein n=1 Tax=Parasitella parasitica TaxID=35722 RepID=A0A0B7NL75_9FUNG|nr:hypothetical protein [Parasitella parasitica]